MQKKLENSLTYKTTPEFWKYYQKLPRDIQSRADKQFQLLKQNPNHPSLMFKKTRRARYWSARISNDYRALAIQDERIFTWVWIGEHDEYNSRI